MVELMHAGRSPDELVQWRPEVAGGRAVDRSIAV
jgi:hypothetical protein